MMRNKIITLFFTAFSLLVYGQKDASELQKAYQQINKYGDVYFKLNIKERKDIKQFPKYISIDSRSIKGNYIKAYVPKNRFNDLLNLHLDFEVIPKLKSTASLEMANSLSEMSNWDKYPTYDVYTEMMRKFATDYPNIAVLDTIGFSQNNHLILALKITSNPSQDEAKPRFFYTAQMHGDELIGQILMLRLIDYLLSNYNSDSQVQNLVDNVEIWINPLANPDGLYNGSDNTVANATRYFNNWVDPNRNFPSPNSPHPDGETYTVETTDMMNFMDLHHFDLSANLHSGAEVANYPWDTWDTSVKTHPDNDWWIHVTSEYANTVFANSSNNYFKGVSPDGIIEGGDWYVIEGGRQDYVTYFKNGREFTLELSADKFLDSQLLPQYWSYNYHSLLNYIQESLYGLRGIVTDANTGEALDAKVEVVNHDMDNSFVFSRMPIGDYHRYLKGGTYDVTFSKQGYISQTINIQVTDNQTTIQNVQLVPETGAILNESLQDKILLFPNPVNNSDIKLIIPYKGELNISLFNSLGNKICVYNYANERLNKKIELPVKDLSKGVYFLKINFNNQVIYKRFIVQ